MLINVDSINVDTCTTCRCVSRYVGAGEAARLLGVQKATLYAYVSRGLIVAHGRRSTGARRCTPLDDIEVLAARAPAPRVRAAAVARRADRHRRDDARRVRAPLPRPRRRRARPDVHVRAGRRAAVDRHAAGHGRVAGGRARRRGAGRRGHPGRRRRQRRAGDGRHGERARRPSPGRRPAGRRPASARRGADRARRPCRRPAAWRPASPPAGARSGRPLGDGARAGARPARRPRAGDEHAGRARSPARRGPGPYPAFAAGLATVQGALHGGAAQEVHDLLVECERDRRGAPPSARRLQARERLPGLRAQDLRGRRPTARPAARGRRACCPTRPAGATSSTTCSPRPACASCAGRTSTSGVGALPFVAGLPADVPLFAVARIAGFAAHLDEELAGAPAALPRPRPPAAPVARIWARFSPDPVWAGSRRHSSRITPSFGRASTSCGVTSRTVLQISPMARH